MAVRLSGPRRNVDRLMSDACVIRRDQNHKADAVLNETTLKLEATTAAATVFDGKCAIVPTGRIANDQAVGGMESSTRSYMVSIPYDASDVHVGDEGTFTASGDSTLVNARFVVRDVVRTTFLVWRQFTVEILETSRG